MRGQEVGVFRVMMNGPGDVSGVERLVEKGDLDPNDIVAILGKTEGNGGVNDFTREYATFALSNALALHLGLSREAVEERIAFVMSGGTEGVISPHITIFSRKSVDAASGPEKRLSIGVAATRPLLPEEIGRAAQIGETAKAVRAAMMDAAISSNQDVHFVQIKCPLLTVERAEAALQRNMRPITKSSYASMGYSRGASALGVAVALDESERPIDEDRVLSDWSVFSSVASASSGIELTRNVVIVLGNSSLSASRFKIGHAVMRDPIDLEAVTMAFADLGIAPGRANPAGRDVYVFAKAEASHEGLVRGLRHTMLDDTDISSTRHARAAVGGLIAGVAGHSAVYVSGGAEHQGPSGGGPIAVIAPC
jgi:cyanuric acid amidohydrolase